MALTFEQFAQRVVESSLVSAADLESVLHGAGEQARTGDGQQLARLLVKQQRLTPFQAQQIYAGKGQALILGNYVVLDKLGQGGMGMVLKAEHRRMKRIVALKVLSPAVTKNPEAARRFQREVEAAAKLEHPNIVTAHDADEARGTHFLVMQYVEGTDLAALVRQQGPLPVDKAIECVVQAARGLEYAHARGVIHRDIKPANLLLDRQGTVKILDMGLARLDTAGHDQDQLTGTGQIMGTVDYMAPEQAMDTKTADARADVYSLGITLWYLLTGRAVYDGESMVKKLMAHQHTPVPSLRAVCPRASAQLEAVFTKMVAKSRDARQQTMAEVIADLERCRSGTVSTPTLPPPRSDESEFNDFLRELNPSGARPLAAKVSKAGTSVLATTPTPPQVRPPDTDSQMQLTISGTTAASALRRRQTSGLWRQRHVWIAAGCTVLALLLLVSLLPLLAPPRDGILRVEIDDAETEVEIQGTTLVLKSGDRGRSIKLAPGNRTLAVRRGKFQFETDPFAMKPGSLVKINVTVHDDQIRVQHGETLLGQGTQPSTPPQAVAPFSPDEAAMLQEAWAAHLHVPVEFENSIQMKLVLIPPGKFTMGTPEHEIGHQSHESPLHPVVISRPFYLGMFEVTSEQWRLIRGQANGRANASLPARDITWAEATQFCQELSEQSVEREAGRRYRLPTEAEWEYACRAGTTTPYAFGVKLTSANASCLMTQQAGGVGQYQPNAFQLYDMHGNVWEVCADYYKPDYYQSSAVQDPSGPDYRMKRVLRGGGANDHGELSCRSGHRLGVAEDYRFPSIGLRVVCDVSDSTPQRFPESTSPNRRTRTRSKAGQGPRP